MACNSVKFISILFKIGHPGFKSWEARHTECAKTVIIILFHIIYFPCNSIIFTKNQNQLVAQYSFLFTVGSPTSFDQIECSSSGSYMQGFFNLELSHVVTTVVFTIITIVKIGL